MAELIILDAFRSELSRQQRAHAIASHDGLKIGDPLLLYETGRAHCVIKFTTNGKPVVLVETLMRALSPHEYEPWIGDDPTPRGAA